MPKSKKKITKSTKSTQKKAELKNKSTRSQKREAKRFQKGKLVSFWRLGIESFKAYWSVKKYFFSLFGVHALLIVFVISDEIIQTQAQIYLGVAVAVFISMMYIALLREAAKESPKPSLENIFFDGPSQIVGFLILLVLSIVQIIPFAFGAFIFQIAIAANVAILLWEQIAFGILWFILSLPSMYWLSTTLMALLVGTLPGVRPWQAWRAAKQLVKGFTIQVVWRVSLFVVVSVSLVISLVLGAFAIGREVFALQVPNYSLAVIIPLFWSYTFALYRDLLSYEKKRS